MKRIHKIMMAIAACAVLSTGAAAFQLKNGQADPGPGATPSAPAAPVPQADLSAGNAPSGSIGTEVRIPGLGRLGVIPKMDFGLELLYGASKDRPIELDQKEQTDGSELTIRGSIKHRF